MGVVRVRKQERILLYDHGGHSFTYELSRCLDEQGYGIDYAYTEGVTAPRGRLDPNGGLRVYPLGRGRSFERYSVVRRAVAEIRLALEALRLARRCGSTHIITCNMPVLVVALIAGSRWLHRSRVTVWLQDSQAQLARGVIGADVMIKVVAFLEAWGLRRANRVIAISTDLRRDAVEMGVTETKITLLHNWAPLDRIGLLGKDSSWSRSHDLSDSFVFLYSGTLGIKHSTSCLVELARHLQKSGRSAQVVVISEGPFADELAAFAASEELPLQVLPFQDASDFPHALAAADVLIVVLEPLASSSSVPSKVWSYLCAGRPILGSIPSENEASELLLKVNGGLISSPGDREGFLNDAERLMMNDTMREQMGASNRATAEEMFSSSRTTADFIASALEGY